MRELYHKHKKEIWLGVVVSLITAAILKLGDWVIAVLPAIGTTAVETILNVLYSLAATHTDNLLLNILLAGGLSALAGTVAKPVTDGIKLYTKTIRLEKKSRNFTKTELEEINNKILGEMKNEKTKPKQESFMEMLVKSKKIGKSAIWVAVLVLFMYFFIFFFISKPMNLYNKFEQDMVKIAPYVEEAEIKQLKSDWVCMRSKSDYDAIYVVIDEVKAEYSLPK